MVYTQARKIDDEMANNELLNKYETEEQDDDADEEEDVEGEEEDKEEMEDDEDETEAEEESEDESEQIEQYTSSGTSLVNLAMLIIGMVVAIVLASYFLGANGFLASIGIVVLAILFIVLSNAKTVNPRYRALIEQWGKFKEYREPGFVWLIPYAQRIRYVDVTEQMVTARPQTVISKDHLNLVVDAQIYFKVKPNKDSVMASQYEAQNYKIQIVSFAGTTLRDIIGKMNFDDANSQRTKINKDLFNAIASHVKKWGIDLARVEIKEIRPPRSVQKQMNRVVATENSKLAAVNTAQAVKTRASGEKEAKIQIAEATKQTEILTAEGKKKADIVISEGRAQAIENVAKADAERIRVVNESAKKHFTGNAVVRKRLNVIQNSLKDNSKVIFSKGTGDLMNIIGDTKVIPVKRKSNEKDEDE